ncbi:MAG: arylsulfatase [Rhodothermales bacterium]
MSSIRPFFLVATLLLGLSSCEAPTDTPQQPPNIVIIYADDLGYGDVSSYGATAIQTPNIDRIAAEGLRFTHAHAPSATCTPSRYAMLTGEYAWRRPGTGVARGNASLIIEPGRTTLADVMKQAGYATGVVGKWHLGLGGPDGPDWNGDITPGPLELGFDEAFLIPATGDRVPTVYVKDRRIVGLDASDPIAVSFDGPIGDEPTGKEHPELLKMHPSHGHDMTIVNGISRIGWMSGGQSARWVDEDMADVIAGEAVGFMERHQDEPFFLYFATHDIHVPRVPHPRFAGQSGMGPRGDAILQLDWTVGEVLDALDRLGLTDNTLVIFSSDNGPVVDDGYQDQAVELLGDHTPSGPYRGGKYSAFEAGTRVPFLVRWPASVAPGTTSDALISQIDLMASFAAMRNVPLTDADAPDSFDLQHTLIGHMPAGREHLVEHNTGGTLSIIRGDWKYIEPSDRAAYNAYTNTELGNAPTPQLYNLADDPGERTNVAEAHPDIAAELAALLEGLKSAGRSRAM